MIAVKGLIWDDWNRGHIITHNVMINEVEEACHNSIRIVESFRKRIVLIGKTEKGRLLIIILSPEDRNLKEYGNGLYYPITAFEEVK